MAAVHEHTLRAPVAPSHVQLACDGTYLALPHGRTDIGVWSLQDITCKVSLCWLIYMDLKGYVNKEFKGLSER